MNDAEERTLFEKMRPLLLLSSSDQCSLSMTLYRVTPRFGVKGEALVDIRGVLLFERSCGVASQVGEVVSWSMTLGPEISGVRAIEAFQTTTGHGESCQHTDKCGDCEGLQSCILRASDNGVLSLPLYLSTSDHQLFLSTAECAAAACGAPLSCSNRDPEHITTALNVGEFDAPLVQDLSLSGVITEGNGWVESELFDYDPWSGLAFGGASGVREALLADPASVGCSVAP